MKNILVVCTTDSMIWNFLIPHINELEKQGYNVECACSRTGDFFEKLVSNYNIKMNLISFDRLPYKFTNIKAYYQLKQIIRKKNIDTIFCHEPVGGAIGRLAGKSCNCNIIYMAHGFHFYIGAPKSRKLYYFVEKYLSKYTDILITINQEDYEASLKFNAKKNVKLNGIGVDTSKFEMNNKLCDYIKQEFSLRDEAIVMLSVGELIHRKNHEVIIDALSKLKNNNIYYFIAGDGEIKDYLQEKINNLNLQSNVFLLGYRNDINKLCNGTDIFIMPSVHEGLSVALMEAMCCGKPVIASRIRGNVDLIDEGNGGFLCNTFNSSDYANKIRILAESKELRYKFGTYNNKKIKGFDIRVVRKKLIEVFTLKGGEI